MYGISIRELNIGQNLDNEDGHEVAKAIGEFIGKNANIVKLSLKGSTGTRFKEGLIPFFRALATNQSLKELDIEDNKIGDDAFQVLTQALRTNTILATLRADNNEIKTNGFMALKQSLTLNRTLTYMPYPHHDYDAASSWMSDQKKRKLRETLHEIQFMLAANHVRNESPQNQADQQGDLRQSVRSYSAKGLPKVGDVTDIFADNTVWSTVEPLAPLPSHLQDAVSEGNWREAEVEENQEISAKPPVFPPAPPPPTPKPTNDQAVVEKAIALSDSPAPNSTNPFDDDSGEGGASAPTGELQFKEGDEIIVIEKRADGNWLGELNGVTGTFERSYTDGKIEELRALCNYDASADGTELSFKEGEVITVVKRYNNSDWTLGELKGQTGFFPHHLCLKSVD